MTIYEFIHYVYGVLLIFSFVNKKGYLELFKNQINALFNPIVSLQSSYIFTS